MNTRGIILTAITTTLLYSCKTVEEAVPTPGGNPDKNTTGFTLGWQPTDNLGEVPVVPKFGVTGADNLPASFDITQYLPPVGNQGAYGTCVAWAAGYYTKTAIEGIAKGYTTAQLSSPAYQISPRDLFTSVPDEYPKGKQCDGISLGQAVQVLLDRGAATLNTVPYTNLGDCNKGSASASWDADAAKHKIKSYRLLDPTIVAIKQQLVNKVPVIIGALLADNFMTWNSDNVLSSNTTYDKVGMHAGHELTIVGYDDKKGPNGAVKIINSWGTSWGSKGFIWVDYNFLLNTFVIKLDNVTKEILVINENVTKPTDDPKPNPTPTTQGVDLVAWVDSDQSTYSETGSSVDRAVGFNIYNTGSADATPKTPWTAYYIYYNARDANDYGILFQHTYTTKNLGANKYNCVDGTCNLNMTIPAYSSLSETLFGDDSGVKFSYKMPSSLNGSYYLVLIVDGDDTFDEDSEEDNFFYTTDRPIKFRNGYAARQGYEQAGVSFSFKNQLSIKSPEKSRRQFTSVIKPGNLNAYSPQEIFSFIRNQKKSGAFAQKVQQYERHQTTQSLRPVASK
jgi:hypothetical protein